VKYTKYHALGNDYVVIRPADLDRELSPDLIRRICHRNCGIGSDGILLGPIDSQGCDFGLRIFNPDGTEAEKSGNGLRIFARSLWDERLSTHRCFSVETPGGPVRCEVRSDVRYVTVDMGEVSFDSTRIPVEGPPRQVLNEEMTVGGQRLEFCAATVGNPHCVILAEHATPEDARRYGPLIETDSRFPSRTNVQFMTILDRENIRIEIWERGAGYTLASGSSSTAAAAVARKLGLCESDIRVHMPGGPLSVQLTDRFRATLAGPVAKICDGVVAAEMLEDGGQN
jgi:diaminopimelate epimerase